MNPEGNTRVSGTEGIRRAIAGDKKFGQQYVDALEQIQAATGEVLTYETWLENMLEASSVTIEVTGGVAECTAKSAFVRIEIIDHDNEEAL